MENPSDAIERFFQSLERETITGDMTAVTRRFAEPFLAASPGGAKVAQRSTFTQEMPARKELFDKLGAHPPRLIALETTKLDARYTLAKSRWQLTFERAGLPPQEVFADSTYIVDTGEEPFKIILYLTSQDLPKLLAERGILPA